MRKGPSSESGHIHVFSIFVLVVCLVVLWVFMHFDRSLERARGQIEVQQEQIRTLEARVRLLELQPTSVISHGEPVPNK